MVKQNAVKRTLISFTIAALLALLAGNINQIVAEKPEGQKVKISTFHLFPYQTQSIERSN